jgi:probable rRNA maturation factor
MMKFSFCNESETEVNEEVFRELLKKVGGDGEINLILVDNKKIQKLNKQYRGIDKATDVLSFDYGDIFIAMPIAKKQAQEKEHSLEQELSILFVHGVLHVLGHTHKNDDDEAEMEREARKILND